MWIAAILLLVLVVCAAMLWNEGLWGNAITLVNVVLAAMLATNYYEPLADLLDGKFPKYTYFADFVSLWLIFTVTYFVMRLLTDTLSKYRVRFKMPVEEVVGIVLAGINHRRREPIAPGRILKWTAWACLGIWGTLLLVLLGVLGISELIPAESRSETFEKDRRLMAVAMAHQYEYLYAGVATVILAFKIWRARPKTPESTARQSA